MGLLPFHPYYSYDKMTTSSEELWKRTSTLTLTSTPLNNMFAVYVNKCLLRKQCCLSFVSILIYIYTLTCILLIFVYQLFSTNSYTFSLFLLIYTAAFEDHVMHPSHNNKTASDWSVFVDTTKHHCVWCCLQTNVCWCRQAVSLIVYSIGFGYFLSDPVIVRLLIIMYKQIFTINK